MNHLLQIEDLSVSDVQNIMNNAFLMKNIHHSTMYNKTITINAASNETIDGTSNYVINTNRGSVTLMCDGINGWMIIGKYSG